MKKINISKFARHIAAYHQVKPDYRQPHEEAIQTYLDMLPSGSGIDSGITFHWEESNAQRLQFTIPYHHMDENGYYDGWKDYGMDITPSLEYGFQIKLRGRDKNDTKEYLHQLLDQYFYFDTSEPTFKSL